MGNFFLLLSLLPLMSKVIGYKGEVSVEGALCEVNLK